MRTRTKGRLSVTAADGEAGQVVPVWRKRVGAALWVWLVGVVVVVGMLIAVMLPQLCRSSETANRVKCGSNLRQIGQAIELYTKDNGGRYPPSLSAVLERVHEDVGSEVMTCPSSDDTKAAGADLAATVAELSAAETNAPGHKQCLSYVYAGAGLTTKTVKDATVVAYEHLENHDRDGTNVLFGDGHVEFVQRKQWEKVSAEAGLAAGAGATTRR